MYRWMGGYILAGEDLMLLVIFCLYFFLQPIAYVTETALDSGQ